MSEPAVGSAVLVLDMLDATDRIHRSAPREAAAVASLIARARAAGLPIIFVDDYRSSGPRPVGTVRPGSSRQIAPDPGDLCLLRGRLSAFDSSPLDDALRDLSIGRVILVGRGTERAILSSAIDASARQIGIAVARDAVIAIDASLAPSALDVIERGLRADVADAIALELSPSRTGAAPAPPAMPPVAVPQIRPSADRHIASAFVKSHPGTDTRQRLVNALAVVIARSGFAGAKITDVATEARASLRTFYAEFGSKEECFLELHRQVMTMIDTSVRATVVFDRPWVEVMRSGFTTYFTILTLEPRLTRAVLHELATISEDGRQARDNAMNFFGVMLREMVEEGRAANPDVPSRPLSELSARAIIGAVIELANSVAALGDQQRMADAVETATEMLTSTVLVRPLD